MTKEITLEGRSHLNPERDVQKQADRAELRPSDYMDDLAELGLTDEQATEFLSTLFSIMRSFVEMGFKVDVCAHLFSNFNNASGEDSDLSYASDNNQDNAGRE